VDRFEDLVEGKLKIEEEDIVVAVKTGNYWNQFLTALRAIVTVEGSPTAHPMLIGRERNIPCVIGCPDALNILRPFDRQWVTLDGLRRRVYAGRLPLIEASSEALQARFGPPDDVPLPSDTDSKKFLLQAGRAIIDDTDPSILWVANPEPPLPPTWCTLTLEGLALRHDIVAASQRKTALSASRAVLTDVTMVKDGRVFDRMQPLKETMAVFRGMSLAECQHLLDHRGKAIQDYLQACEALGRAPTTSAWEAYAEAYRLCTAHKWLSWFFRTYVEQRAVDAAREVGCSQFHLESMSESLQAAGSRQEMDNQLYQQICGVARAATVDGVGPNSTLASVQSEHPAIFQKVATIAKQFKISKSTDIRQKPPLDELWAKVQEQMQRLDNLQHASDESTEGTIDAEDYYPEEPTVTDWVRLAIQARVQHCDSHHLHMRGQWIVRDALLNLGGLDLLEKSAVELEALLQ
jgi:phosphohistidine swiveling domain-containing protein